MIALLRDLGRGLQGYGEVLVKATLSFYLEDDFLTQLLLQHLVLHYFSHTFLSRTLLLIHYAFSTDLLCLIVK
jgi:hypothetical protein